MDELIKDKDSIMVRKPHKPRHSIKGAYVHRKPIKKKDGWYIRYKRAVYKIEYYKINLSNQVIFYTKWSE